MIRLCINKRLSSYCFSPRSGISIDELFVGTKKANVQPGADSDFTETVEDFRRTIAEEEEDHADYFEEEMMNLPCLPTYRGIYSRDLRKRVTVFGNYAPQLLDIKFSFDNQLKNLRCHSKEFKELVGKMQ